MITYEKACKIAKDTMGEDFEELSYVRVRELADRWSFQFNRDAYSDMCPPPTFFVFKEDGRVQWYSIPPLENLDLLDTGKMIDFIG